MTITKKYETDVLIRGDGTSLSAKLSFVSARNPLLVFAHGFGGNKDERGLFTEAAEYFVGAGFSVLRFDFRGCGDNHSSFKHVRFLDLQTDLLNVVRFIEKDLQPKPESIGIIGFSLGASIAILTQPKSVKAYSFWSPAIFTGTDMYPRYNTPEIQDELRRNGSFAKSGIEVGLGFLQDLKENLIPVKMQDISKPVLLVHGEGDARISVSSTKQAAGLFRRRAKICLIPGANHSFRDNPIHRNYAFSATEKFFNSHLRNNRARNTSIPLSLFEQTTQSRIVEPDVSLPS